MHCIAEGSKVVYVHYGMLLYEYILYGKLKLAE